MRSSFLLSEKNRVRTNMIVPVLVMSDIQFHSYKAHSRLVNGVNSRLLYQIEAWKKAVSIGVKHGCRLLLIPGDIFEVRGVIKPSVFNRVTELVIDALGKGFDIGVIPGNHDMEHLDAGESAIDSWDYLRSGSAVNATLCKVFKTAGVYALGGHRILGIPYVHDIEAFKAVFLELSAAEAPDITIIHQGIDNFNSDGAYPSTGLTAEWLEEHNSGITLCGHYHRPGLSRGGRVINVGALVQHRFSDEGSDRGCWVLHGGQVEFISIDSPRFVTIAAPGPVGPNCRGAIVRIRANQQKAADKLRKEAEATGALSVVVEIEKEFKPAHEKTVAISSPREMIGEYLDIVEKYKPYKEEIMELFGRICVH
jgi:DNA repair exonuclease SbcCD nuclease subunit